MEEFPTCIKFNSRQNECVVVAIRTLVVFRRVMTENGQEGRFGVDDIRYLDPHGVYTSVFTPKKIIKLYT